MNREFRLKPFDRPDTGRGDYLLFYFFLILFSLPVAYSHFRHIVLLAYWHLHEVSLEHCIYRILVCFWSLPETLVSVSGKYGFIGVWRI